MGEYSVMVKGPRCPFCGRSDLLTAIEERGRFYVLCGSCDAQGPGCPTREDAVRRWARDPGATMGKQGIGIRGDGRADPDYTETPGTCACGGKTWRRESERAGTAAYWQCEGCGRCYPETRRA